VKNVLTKGSGIKEITGGEGIGPTQPGDYAGPRQAGSLRLNVSDVNTLVGTAIGGSAARR